MERPKIKNLTPEGRLQPADYNASLDYLRQLNTEAQKYSEGRSNPASDEAFAYMETLPEEDSSQLLETIMQENIGIKVTGVNVKLEKR